MSLSRKTGAVARRHAPLIIAGTAAAAGTGLFLWSRRPRPAGQESGADEVQAHPS